jgi:RNA ligase (TIGR02306 family)
MANSTHRVEVFRVSELEKHPNADTLSVMKVFNYQAVVRTSDFNVGDLACYIPPDNVLPDKPEFAFLKNRHIKAAKLRGIMSQGLVLAAPAGAQEGDDVAELMGIVHYVPEIKNTGDGETIAAPPFAGEVYDIDSWFRYDYLIPDGTLVEITEKLDGANTRASFQDGQLWVSSRENWRKESPGGLFWRAMHENPWLERLCRQNEEAIVYGELFGKVQELRYGSQGNQVWFRMFDIMTPKGYMSHAARMAALLSATANPITGASWESCYAPVLYVGPLSREVAMQYVNGPSTVPGATNEREGIVIKPLEEMWSPEIGRLILKAVSPVHLEKKKG